MQKLIYLTTLSILLLSGCDVRKKDRVATNMPPQEIKDPTTVQVIDSVYDFGNVTEGEIIEYNYRFKNTGDKPLVVSNVSASCGCTVPERPEEPVKPGETGYIKVKFNSDKRPGQVHKTVTVTSNANPPFTELILKGEVTGKP